MAPWGHSPTPLLPASLRRVWERERAPESLERELGRELNCGSLTPEMWGDVESVGDSVLDDLAQMLARNLPNVRDENALDSMHPLPIGADTLPLRQSTIVAVGRVLELAPSVWPENVTFGYLDRFPGVGPKIMLDLACVLEASAAPRVERAPDAQAVNLDDAAGVDATSWGTPPTPFLPARLCALWSSELLPPACKYLFGDDARMGDLDDSVWRGVEYVDAGLLQALLGELSGFVHARIGEISAEQLLPTFLTLDGAHSLPLRDHTRVAIRSLPQGDMFSRMSVGELVGHGLDSFSLLDLACVAESARPHAHSPRTPMPSRDLPQTPREFDQPVPITESERLDDVALKVQPSDGALPGYPTSETPEPAREATGDRVHERQPAGWLVGDQAVVRDRSDIPTSAELEATGEIPPLPTMPVERRAGVPPMADRSLHIHVPIEVAEQKHTGAPPGQQLQDPADSGHSNLPQASQAETSGGRDEVGSPLPNRRRIRIADSVKIQHGARTHS